MDEKCIDFYCGEYKSGIFGKKAAIRLGVYSSQIKGEGFSYYDTILSNSTYSFEIEYDNIKRIYIGEVGKDSTLFIEYDPKAIVNNKTTILALPGMENAESWLNTIEETKRAFIEKKQKQQQIRVEREEEQRRLEAEKEQEAIQFYQKCYSFHIKETTPVYQLFSDRNKTALIYIDEKKSLNFLK